MTTRNAESSVACEAPPVRCTVAPGVSSRISLKTARNAICTLRVVMARTPEA